MVFPLTPPDLTMSSTSGSIVRGRSPALAPWIAGFTWSFKTARSACLLVPLAPRGQFRASFQYPSHDDSSFRVKFGSSTLLQRTRSEVFALFRPSQQSRASSNDQSKKASTSCESRPLRCCRKSIVSLPAGGDLIRNAPFECRALSPCRVRRRRAGPAPQVPCTCGPPAPRS